MSLFNNWYHDSSLVDQPATLVTTGAATYEAAAAPADNVSLARVLRSIYDRQLADGTDASTSVLGLRVQRATADLMSSAAIPVMTIGTGQVLMSGLVGTVTTIIGAGTTPDQKFTINPTTGTDTDICATADVGANEAGCLWSVSGVFSEALVVSSATTSGAVPWMTRGVVLDIGTLDTINDENVSGSVSLDFWFIPLEDGSTFVTA